MRHHSVIAALLVSVLCLLIPDPAHSVGGFDPPRDAFLPDPNDSSCPEDDWPHYYYRLPVIFQYTNDAGKLEFFAFGYADGCKYKTNEKTRGGTHANIQLIEDIWADNIMHRYAALNAQARPLTEDTHLEGIAYPGNNAYRWPLPQIHLEYQTLYNDQKARCRYHADDVELICPGIPPEAAELLTRAGFQTNDPDEGEPLRFLIDLSYIEGARPEAAAGWFLSGISTRPPNPAENFYARHWGFYNRNDHSDGGLFRIILFPVDFALQNLAPETKVASDGTAHVSVNVGLLTEKRVPTWVGWRIKDEETEWRHGRSFTADDLISKAAVKADFTITGVKPGQTIEVKVNPDHSVAEAKGDAVTDAYKDNSGETTLEAADVDLEVVSVSAPAQVPWEPGATYKVTWVIRNNSQTATATGRRTATINGTQPLRAGTVTLGPGESRTEEHTVTPRKCSDQLQVVVQIAPAEGETDSNPANNSGSRTTAVGDCAPPPPGGTTQQQSMTIIVPADCVPNPDASSSQPCLNYPNLRTP